jgi:hypothetical protein
VPSAQERDDIGTCVIFAKDLQRLIDRRRSFMIEVADAFLTGDHGENLSIEQVSETGHDMLGQDSTRRSAQWIFSTFVQSANLIAIVAANLHPRTECPNRGKLLDCEADSFRCRGEPTIVDTLMPPATTALWNEQLGR